MSSRQAILPFNPDNIVYPDNQPPDREPDNHTIDSDLETNSYSDQESNLDSDLESNLDSDLESNLDTDLDTDLDSELESDPDHEDDPIEDPNNDEMFQFEPDIDINKKCQVNIFERIY